MLIPFRHIFSCAATAILVSVLVLPSSLSASPVSTMRPYAGIGVLILPVSSQLDDESFERLNLYDKPAMSRLKNAQLSGAPRYDWIFALESDLLPVIVTARKGEWLKVAYDDAGREGWIKPWRRSGFKSWDDFFEGRVIHLLPGLQKRHYQLFGQPGAEPLLNVASHQLFNVVLLKKDWALVQDGRILSGWVRWRDDDGRFLVGLAQAADASNTK